ncbi:MAG: alkaline phosphatase, partial [Victivallaceae bacterium]|nr:alkaline phosphatase [Victivallaceae bacterium]
MLKLFFLFLALSGMFNELCAEKIKHNNTLYNGKGAKYVFLFIGDGMGAQQRLVAEKAFGAELWMNTLPVKAFVSTSPYGGGVTDSAAAATAFACGQKTQNHVLGLDHKGKSIESVAETAKKLGWKIAIVSSVPLNHATPAAFYAHQPKRYMYNEIIQDIAVSNFDYFGGGSFIIKNKREEALKALKDNNYIMIGSPEKMPRLDSNKKYIVHSKLPYVIDRNENSGLSLADYTRLGIKHVYTGAGKTKGFFMMVEGGKIDWSGHVNDGGSLIHEVKALDDAVKVALDFYKKHPESTTIIITADHETGGLHFSPNVKSAQLLKQKHSYAVMNSRLSKYKKEKLSFEKVLSLLQGNYGIKKFSTEELKKLRKVRDMRKTKVAYPYKALLRCIQRIFNERCGLKESAKGRILFSEVKGNILT